MNWAGMSHRAFIRSSMAAPIFAGDSTTVTPAALKAAILSVAVPLPPEMMAPACPMRRPGGAVRPAIKDTTGFLVLLDCCDAQAHAVRQNPTAGGSVGAGCRGDLP